MPNIKTYCRIKPAADIYDEYESSKTTLYLRVPEVLKDFTSNQKGSRTFVNHEFNFEHVFLPDVTQQNVFDVVALDIVNAFLNGYNGTIFAYGQTGTGKTYTIEGSAKTYHSRGLEPRALSMIYKELEQRSSEDLSIHISYIEIYQDVGYDLLNPGVRTGSYVTPFPKVNVIEGPNGQCVVRNLTNHLAGSEDVAQSLLLQGQGNRKIAATAIHDRSSRSHAVFTIQLTSKKLDSDTVIRSKLHLVDLAGSERVAKTRVLGHQLTEAKSINLSLHHLETVIVALQEEAINNQKGRRATTSIGSRRYTFNGRPSSADGIRGPRHVPYRNSLLTMLLRDSLGGNCMTAMIATISLEISNLGESISTCRFAGRVACIANSVSRNEELDEKSLIRKLRKRIAELETELSCIKLAKEGDGDIRMKLTEEDKLACAQVVSQYLMGKLADPVSAGITDPYKFRECLRILKKVISKSGGDPNNNMPQQLALTLPGTTGEDNEADDTADLVVMETLQRNNQQKLREERENGGVRPNENRPIPKPRSRQSAPPPVRRSASFEMPRQSSADTPAKPGQATEKPAGRRETTQAWVNTTAGENGVASANTEGERVWTANSKKDPETLSQLLQDPRDKARTPFEQKRVQEIKKLNKTVEKIHADRTEKEQQVMDIKMQVAEKELDLMERHMKTKLGVTTAQVQDQTAYVKQLVNTEADPGLIEQEKLVEKQLRRRMERYERQLEYIGHRRSQLKTHMEGGTQMSEEAMTSLQEKYGQFRNRDGSLNTRQVFQMLKTEEKKEHKVRTYLEREKVVATANLMEVKELATRQKLRELKEAMASGKPFLPPEAAQNGMTNGGHDGSHLESGHNGQGPSQSYDDGERMKQPPREGFMTNGDTSKDEDRMNSSFNQNNLVPNSDFYANKKSEKDPKAKWESSYSRPTTPSNQTIQAETKKSSQYDRSESKVSFNLGDRSNDQSRLQTPEKRKQVLSEEDMLEIQSKRFEKELSNSRMRRSQEKDNTDQRTFMPSEYVNQTNSGQFDARKMNLSAKNFDSALSSMLGQENAKLIPDSGEYEQYARTSKYRPNPYLEQRQVPPSRSRSTKGQRSERPRESRSAERAKPSTVSAPVSAKQSRYGQDSPVRRREPKPKPATAGLSRYSAERYEPTAPWKEFGLLGGKVGFDMQKFLLESHVNTSGKTSMLVEIEDEPPSTGRIVAMKEDDREKTYMSKAQVERNRVTRIRKARQSAEIIQRAWRRYRARLELHRRRQQRRR